MGSLFALLFFCHQAAAQQDQNSWHVLIEPTFMRPEVSFPIAGARRTALVPGYMSDGDPHYFSKKEWDALGLTWEAFRARAARNATEKKLTGDLIRDHNKAVQYASISSDYPLTATMVLAPDFLKKFKDIFGPSVLVALPNRFTVFVFPEVESPYKDYAQLVLQAYHESAYPVSTEVFEISSTGIKAIGAFED